MDQGIFLHVNCVPLWDAAPFRWDAAPLDFLSLRHKRKRKLGLGMPEIDSFPQKTVNALPWNV